MGPQISLVGKAIGLRNRFYAAVSLFNSVIDHR